MAAANRPTGRTGKAEVQVADPPPYLDGSGTRTAPRRPGVPTLDSEVAR